MKEQSPEKSCKQYGEQISVWLDGQLSEDQSAVIEAHLKECPQCAKQAEEYRILQNLMNATRQKCPIDLASTVMGNLEREQLLNGLDELAKPPMPRWIKRLRTLAAAAMIGLVVYSGFLVAPHFTRSTPKSLRSTESLRQSFDDQSDAKIKRKAARRNASRTTEINRPAVSKNTRGVAAEDALAGDLKPTMSVRSDQTPLGPDDHGKTMKSSPTLPSTLAMGAAAKPATAKDLFMSPVDLPPVLKPAPPLALRPSSSAPTTNAISEPASAEYADAYAHSMSLAAQPQSRYLDQLIPLYYRLSAPDLPSWMLLKEQVLAILGETGLATITESEQVPQALAANREFCYQARKGLDLSPGSVSAHILIRVRADNVAKIRERISQTAWDNITQDMHPELAHLLNRESPSVRPELTNLARKTIRNLDAYFAPHSDDGEILAERAENASTQSAADVQGEKEISDEVLLPIMVIVDLNPHPRTTTAPTQPATTQP